MAWKIRITDEAKKDYGKIEESIRKQVLAGIIKVSQAPLQSPNGYGKPLGNKNGNNTFVSVNVENKKRFARMRSSRRKI